MDSALIILAFAVFCFVIFRTDSHKLDEQQDRIEKKLDAVIAHLGMDWPLYQDIPNEVLDALDNGDRNKAIRLYQDFSGLGLKEASDVIMALEKSRAEKQKR